MIEGQVKFIHLPVPLLKVNKEVLNLKLNLLLLVVISGVVPYLVHLLDVALDALIQVHDRLRYFAGEPPHTKRDADPEEQACN